MFSLVSALKSSSPAPEVVVSAAAAAGDDEEAAAFAEIPPVGYGTPGISFDDDAASAGSPPLLDADAAEDDSSSSKSGESGQFALAFPQQQQPAEATPPPPPQTTTTTTTLKKRARNEEESAAAVADSRSRSSSGSKETKRRRSRDYEEDAEDDEDEDDEEEPLSSAPEEGEDDDDDDNDADDVEEEEDGAVVCRVGGKLRRVPEGKVAAELAGFRATLTARRDENCAQQQQRYMKGMVRFIGLKTPLLRTLFLQYHAERLEGLPTHVQVHIAYRLLASEFSEEKAAGVLMLVKNLRSLNARHIVEIGELIDAHVHEWSTCDSIASKVLNLMIKRDPKLAGNVAVWKDSSSTWRLRACCVAFVKIARFGGHNTTIAEVCSACVRHHDRFVQLGVGWLLRELSLADIKGTVAFIKQHYEYFSREGLRYALEKMEDQLRKSLLELKTTKDVIAGTPPAATDALPAVHQPALYIERAGPAVAAVVSLL